MTGRLIERSGARAGKVHLLGPAMTTIGRDDDNNLVLAEDHVSRHHARVAWDGQRYVLHDLGSKNGTFLNGRRIAGPEPLAPGDLIGLPGLTLRFDFSRSTVTWQAEADGDTAAAGDWLRIDASTAEVRVDGARTHLTAKEYLALCLLAERRGALVTKDELAARVWPEYQGDVSDDNIERLISRLRHKLQGTAAAPRLLAVRALGYRLLRDAAEAEE